jgi:hypothetical protein
MAMRLPKKSKSQPDSPQASPETEPKSVKEDADVKKAIKKVATRKSPEQLAKERYARIAPYQWKPGQSGNPLGRPPGSGSIVAWLKKRLDGPAIKRPDKFISLAQELADVIVRQAKKANYNFVQLLIDRAESRQLTEEEMMRHTEKIFNVVCKYVDDPEIRKNIARDLGCTAKEKYE